MSGADSSEGPAGAKPARANRRARALVKALLTRPEISALVMLVLVVIGFQIWTGGLFVSIRNFKVVLPIWPELGIVVLGIVFLMIAGEFDLSVGSVFAFTPMFGHFLAARVGLDPVLALLLSFVAAIAIGYVNGAITLRFGIPSFITTLGMLYFARSLAIKLAGGFPPPMPADTPTALFVYNFGVFRASFLWFLGLALILGFVLHRTNFGNWVYAAGGQRQAAQDMGIDVRRVKLACFMLCAFLAGLAGTIQTYRLHQPLPSIGTGLELQAISAAVIGGTSLFGGVGSILGALIGSFLVRGIDNGIVMARVDAEWFRAALGLLLVVAVIVNVSIRRWANQMRL